MYHLSWSLGFVCLTDDKRIRIPLSQTPFPIGLASRFQRPLCCHGIFNKKPIMKLRCASQAVEHEILNLDPLVPTILRLSMRDMLLAQRVCKWF